MDASGKDGVVRYIFSGMNPLGTRACGFRVPTKEEASHDFLWRIHKQVPAKGMVQIFNRSHYEDILVPTVEKFLPKEEIEKRYDQINDFEKMLEQNGTIILKFYLHVSKTKQKEKLNERLTDPTKYRKHNIGDRQTRDEYDKYMEVYERVFAECKNPERHIIPADQNRYKINCIAKILHKTFKDLNLKWPKLSEDQETSLLRAKAELEESKEDEKENKKEDKIDKEAFEKELQRKLAKEIAKVKKEEEKKIKKMQKEGKKKVKKE
jgi:PPK2 family polyphosphate:nucleotide phosphotransferase